MYCFHCKKIITKTKKCMHERLNNVYNCFVQTYIQNFGICQTFFRPTDERTVSTDCRTVACRITVFLNHIVLKTNQVMNPLDARCNIDRDDAICVSQLKNARDIDPAVLQERPDVKIFLPFRFFVYRPEMLFQPNTYNRFLGMYNITS